MLFDEATNGKAQRRMIVRTLICLIKHLRDEKTVELITSKQSEAAADQFGNLKVLRLA